jgi:monoamine oxidase
MNGSAKQDYDIVIVGAGVAGLAAMREAERKGLRACIVEARDRIGGRIYTMRDPRCAHPIELGAEFIHGCPSELLDIVREACLLAYVAGGERWRSLGGRLTRIHDFWKQLHRVMRYVDAKKPDRSFAEFLSDKPGGRSAAEARRLACAFVEGFHAADATRISARWVAQGGSPSEEPDERSAMRIADGYDLIPDWLARGFRERIMTNSVVERIDWEPQRAQLSVRRDESRSITTITGRAAVVTVPLGVLLAGSEEPGAIVFSPPLELIERTRTRLAMGSVTRVTILFRDRWWTQKLRSARGASLESLTFLHGDTGDLPVWWSLHPMLATALVGWAGGPAALQLSQRDDVEERVIASVAANFGVTRRRVAAQLVQVFTHDWQHDPFSRGAYSYGLVGGADWAKRLARPLDSTLWLAGEAASREGNTGTVHGAMASGHQAAQSVARTLA